MYRSRIEQNNLFYKNIVILCHKSCLLIVYDKMCASQQAEALQLLTGLFSRLLSVHSNTSLVHHISLETFARFAELTSHESVVANSIGADGLTRQTVVSFLSRVRATYPVNYKAYCCQLFRCRYIGYLSQA